MRIIVNGVPIDLENTPFHLTYEQVVKLAGETGNPSVTYCSKRDGDTQRSGTMYSGCAPVLLTDVMVFNVVHTDGA